MPWVWGRRSLLAAILLSPAAHASFGGGGACATVGCYFLMFGILVGVSGGMPASAVVFALIHFFFRHPERPKATQLVVGLFIGIAAFLVAALGASFMAVNNWNAAAGFLVPYALMAALSVRHARSAPAPRASRS